MAMSPGTYIRLRREAEGLSIADVAARIATEPRLPEHERADWLEQIEADVTPASLRTLVVLQAAGLSLDLEALETLTAIRLGLPLLTPSVCDRCACSAANACVDAHGQPCGWSSAASSLCTLCADRGDPDDGERIPAHVSGFVDHVAPAERMAA